MATILLVEEDLSTRTVLGDALTDRGHDVLARGAAFDALRNVVDARPDIVVLGLGLPDPAGEALLRMLRLTNVPVIVTTGKAEEANMVRLLDLGADDCLAKPLSCDLLAARIDAVLRRYTTGSSQAGVVRIGDLSINLEARTVRLASSFLYLTRKEFDLLAVLARHAGTVVDRTDVAAEIWPSTGENDQALRVHLSSLRRKLGETAATPRYLHTVRGIGLRLGPPGDPA